MFVHQQIRNSCGGQRRSTANNVSERKEKIVWHCLPQLYCYRSILIWNYGKEQQAQQQTLALPGGSFRHARMAEEKEMPAPGQVSFRQTHSPEEPHGQGDVAGFGG